MSLGIISSFAGTQFYETDERRTDSFLLPQQLQGTGDSRSHESWSLPTPGSILMILTKLHSIQLYFLLQIVKESYVDHTQFDKKDVHYDASSKPDNPKWSMVKTNKRQLLQSHGYDHHVQLYWQET